MTTSSCLNENPVRIIIRTESSSDLNTRKVLGNIKKGELIYDESTNKLYICTQSTDGIANGVIVEIGT